MRQSRRDEVAGFLILQQFAIQPRTTPLIRNSTTNDTNEADKKHGF
jgi:hypothetical protein